MQKINNYTQLNPTNPLTHAIKTGGNEKVMFPFKVRISKIPAKRLLYRSPWAQIFQKQVSNFSKTPEKNIPGPILDLGRPEKDTVAVARTSDSW